MVYTLCLSETVNNVKRLMSHGIPVWSKSKKMEFNMISLVRETGTPGACGPLELLHSNKGEGFSCCSGGRCGIVWNERGI